LAAGFGAMFGKQTAAKVGTIRHKFHRKDKEQSDGEESRDLVADVFHNVSKDKDAELVANLQIISAIAAIVD
jgi:hypothetical protein